MGQRNCWVMTVDGLIQSWENEARELREALSGAKGRAWMILSWRAGYLEQAAIRLREVSAAGGSAPEILAAYRRESAIAAECRARSAAECIEGRQAAGLWGDALAVRQYDATQKEIHAALDAVLGASGEAAVAAQISGDAPMWSTMRVGRLVV